MTNNNSTPEGNFWFAFALGSTLVAATVFLLGTRKGRDALRKIIDRAENLDNDSFAKELIKGIEKLASANQNKEERSSSSINVSSLLKKIEGFALKEKNGSN